MQNENIHNLIIRLFSGEASPDEKRLVGDWLNHSENNRKMYTDLQEIWLSAGTEEEYDVKKAIQQFKEKIGKHKTRTISFTTILKYAAIAILIISLPIVYQLGRSGNADETFTTITCSLGDKSSIVLPDGSLVNLNSGSKLTFNNNFHDKYRQVSLEGEAFFSVTKNEDVPFIVSANDIRIQVLGTKFNVKAYPDENAVSTTLVEGSVDVKSATQESILKPNQKLVYNKDDQKMVLYNLSDITPEIEWKDGRLVFRNESLEELELKLERWFDVDIEFADEEVKNRRFTGILERESILEAVTYFNYSDKVGYRIKDNEITFYSK